MMSATLPLESIAEQSRANKSNRGKARVLVMDEAPALVDEEAWKQLRRARYRIPAPETMIDTWIPMKDTTIA